MIGRKLAFMLCIISLDTGCATTKFADDATQKMITKSDETKEAKEARHKALLDRCDVNEDWMDIALSRQRNSVQWQLPWTVALGASAAVTAAMTTTQVLVLQAQDKDHAATWVAMGGGAAAGVLTATAAGLGVSAYLNTEETESSSTRVNAYLDLQRSSNRLSSIGPTDAGFEVAAADAAKYCVYTPRAPVTPAEATAARDGALETVRKSGEAVKPFLVMIEKDAAKAEAEAETEVVNLQTKVSLEADVGKKATLQGRLNGLKTDLDSLKQKRGALVAATEVEKAAAAVELNNAAQKLAVNAATVKAMPAP